MATSDVMPSETSPLLGLGSNGAAPKALNGHIVSEIIPNGASQDGADLESHDSIDESKGILICSRPNNHFFQLWQNRERTRCTQSHQLDCNVLLPNLVIIPT